MHDFLISVIAFVILITIMVVVHELGHFTAAKLFGVNVESFSVGFGPRLFGFRHGGTEYKFCLLPVGGFVKMTAKDPGGKPLVDAPGAYAKHPRWQRILIALAGPAANLLLAFVAMTFYFAFINEVPAYDFTATAIEWIVPGSVADQAGLEPGDVITHFDTEDDPTWKQVYGLLAVNLDETIPITVDRAGKTLQLTYHVPGELKGNLMGMLPQGLAGPIRIQKVLAKTPAAEAGLLDGDAILSVDGHPFHAYSSLLAYMQIEQGKPLSLMVLRNDVTLGPIAAQPVRVDGVWWLGFEAAPVPIRRAPMPLTKAVARSTQYCVTGSKLIFRTLEMVLTHKVSARQLSGPVGIAQMAGDAAEIKQWFAKFDLASEISLNLGIVNLLPFPMLDGWMILLLLIESVLRREINRVVKERIYQAGLAVLVVFFAFIMFSDLSRLSIFAKAAK